MDGKFQVPPATIPAMLGRRQAAWWLAGVAVALVFVAHRDVLRNPFVFDDFHEVVENVSIENLRSPLGIVRQNLSRPIVNLSYAVDYWMWDGRDERGFHLTNLLLHALNVLLLFGLVREIVRARGSTSAVANVTAFTAAALFAVHPLMTEAVGLVASRSELLVGTFLLSSLHCFHRAFESRRTIWLAGGLVLFLTALGTKETAAMLPFLLLAYDVCLRRHSKDDTRARIWRVHVPLVTLIVLAGAVRVWLFLGVEHPQAERAPWHSVLTSMHAAARYIRLLVLPIGQSLIPLVYPFQSPFETRFLVAAGVLAAAGAIVVFSWRREPLVAFGILWFFLLLVPSSALILLSEYGGAMAEHRAYLPGCGVFMAVGAVVARLAGLTNAASRARGAVTLSAVLAVLVVLMGLTTARNRIWNDPIALWTDALNKAPGTWAAVEGLADSYRLAGECRAAVPLYQQAMRLAPKNADTYIALSLCYFQLGRTQDAAAVLRAGRAELPRNTAVRLRLAKVEELTFADPSAALAICREVLAIAPGLAEAADCVRRNETRQSSGRP